jgi:hypothetical protein
VPHPIKHFEFVRAHTSATPKMTIPSPSTLHFRYGCDAVPEAIYPSMEDFYRDLAPAIARSCTPSPRPAAATFSSTRSISPICATRAAPAGLRTRR